jgi:hypothetical protein
MINTYLAGSLVRVSTYAGKAASPVGGFRNSDGVLVNPDTVVLKYKPGASAALVVVTFPASPIVQDGDGLFHADLDTTGFLTTTWTYTWTGTGAGQAIAEGTFNVTVAPF